MLKGKRILITAGPTKEFIDPVRFISNASSGKMGYVIVFIFSALHQISKNLSFSCKELSLATTIPLKVK